MSTEIIVSIASSLFTVLVTVGTIVFNQGKTRGEIEAIRSDLSSFKTEVKSEISEFKQDFKTEIRRLDEKVDRVNEKVDHVNDSLSAKFEKLFFYLLENQKNQK